VARSQVRRFWLLDNWVDEGAISARKGLRNEGTGLSEMDSDESNQDVDRRQ